jgi:hypothetical protein
VQTDLPTTHLTTEVLSETNRRRHRKLLPWLAVPVALASIALALVFAGGDDGNDAARPGVGVYSAQPGAAGNAVEQLPPASAAPPPPSEAAVHHPGVPAVPQGVPAGQPTAKAATPPREERPSVKVIDAPKVAPAARESTTHEADKAASRDEAKARKRDRRPAAARPEKKKGSENVARPTSSEPKEKDPEGSEDSRPDWGY